MTRSSLAVEPSKRNPCTRPGVTPKDSEVGRALNIATQYVVRLNVLVYHGQVLTKLQFPISLKRKTGSWPFGPKQSNYVSTKTRWMAVKCVRSLSYGVS